MKKIVLFFLVIMLTGCTQQNEFHPDLAVNLENLAQSPIDAIADNNKEFYRYYTSQDVGRKESTQTSNVFLYQGETIIMNLDIANIISSKFYTTSTINKVPDEDALFSQTGIYLNSLLEEHEYAFHVYETTDRFLIFLDTAYVDLYAISHYANIDDIAYEMMKISKTVDVDHDEIVALYSSKTLEVYEKEQVDLFDTVIPQEGLLEELLPQTGEGGYVDPTTTTTTTSTPLFEFVTDESGSTITDESGSNVTQVITSLPHDVVTDDEGNALTDTNGDFIITSSTEVDE